MSIINSHAHARQIVKVEFHEVETFGGHTAGWLHTFADGSVFYHDTEWGTGWVADSAKKLWSGDSTEIEVPRKRS